MTKTCGETIEIWSACARKLCVLGSLPTEYHSASTFCAAPIDVHPMRSKQKTSARIGDLIIRVLPPQLMFNSSNSCSKLLPTSPAESSGNNLNTNWTNEKQIAHLGLVDALRGNRFGDDQEIAIHPQRIRFRHRLGE